MRCFRPFFHILGGYLQILIHELRYFIIRLLNEQKAKFSLFLQRTECYLPALILTFSQEFTLKLVGSGKPQTNVKQNRDRVATGC